MNTEDRIKQVLASVLNVDVGEITEDTSQDTLDVWDSLKQMDLVVALEDEFKMSFSQEQIIEMMTFSVVLQIVSEAVSSSEGMIP